MWGAITEILIALLSISITSYLSKENGKKEKEKEFLKKQIEQMNLITDNMKKKREMIDEVNKMDRDSIYNDFI